MRESLGFRSRKGNVVTDTLLVVVVIIAMAIISMIAYQSFTELRPSIIDDIDSTEAEAVIDEVNTRYPPVMDGLVVFAFILLWGAVIVASFFIDSHPIFFIFAFIMLVFVIIAGVMIGNSYEELMQEEDFSSLPAQFPATNWILSNLLLIVLVIGVSIALALYGKNKLGE